MTILLLCENNPSVDHGTYISTHLSIILYQFWRMNIHWIHFAPILVFTIWKRRALRALRTRTQQVRLWKERPCDTLVMQSPTDPTVDCHGMSWIWALKIANPRCPVSSLCYHPACVPATFRCTHWHHNHRVFQLGWVPFDSCSIAADIHGPCRLGDWNC
jgi:hypothetical protein